MAVKYGHTNIITKDWKSLCSFYQKVFNCQPVPPQRDQSGEWLHKGTGVKNANIRGMHLRLPGFGDDGPTLEIFQYDDMIHSETNYPNKEGFGHIAFQTDKIENLIEKAVENGASKVGELTEKEVEGVGFLKFIYIKDPNGNIIEVQSWS